MRLYLALSRPDTGGGGLGEYGNVMRIFLSERDPQHHAWPMRGVARAHMKLRILLSYWYYKDTDLDALFAKYFEEPYPDVFADSGAYSAATQGAQITTRDYAAWVKRWRHLFAVYSNLDCIGDPDGTQRNQSELEDMGISPLPVFHVSSKLEYARLEQLCNQYPYIALGGMVPYMKTPQRLMPHLVKCFKIAAGRSVFHGFGCTSWTILKALPWYSVDSSSWGSGFRFGQVPVFDAGVGKFVDLKLGDREAWLNNSHTVTALGFNAQDFADRSRVTRANVCAISALSYMKSEQWLRQRHGDVVIPGDPGACAGLRTHLADANPQRFSDALQGAAGRRLHLADTSNGVNYGDAQAGLRLHLADARGHSGGDLAAAEAGIRIHLVEHSMDRGGVGDVSRANEVLNR